LQSFCHTIASQQCDPADFSGKLYATMIGLHFARSYLLASFDYTPNLTIRLHPVSVAISFDANFVVHQPKVKHGIF